MSAVMGVSTSTTSPGSVPATSTARPGPNLLTTTSRGLVLMSHVSALPVHITLPAATTLARQSIPLTAHTRHQLSVVRAHHRLSFTAAVDNFNHFQSHTGSRTPLDTVSNFLMPHRRFARIRLMETIVTRAREYVVWCQRQIPLWRQDSVEADLLHGWLDEAFDLYEQSHKLLGGARRFRMEREVVYAWLDRIEMQVRLTQRQKPQWKLRQQFATMNTISKAADGQTARKLGWKARGTFWGFVGTLEHVKDRVTGKKKKESVVLADLQLVAPPPGALKREAGKVDGS